MHRFSSLIVIVFIVTATTHRLLWSDDHLPLEHITLPDGFSIEVYADSVPNARQMALSPNGILYVGSMQKGVVHAVVDSDGDMAADELYTVAEDLVLPTGLTFHDGSLYVAAVSKILRYDDMDTQLQSPPDPVVIVDDLPTERHHGWKFIAFGPDGKLYVPVGAPCNVCESDEIFATVLRMNADGSEREIYAHGIRNSVGFDWHPVTGELWITDNGSDNISPDPAITDNLPSCELNHAPKPGMHFGYPYYHQGDTPDPEFGEGRTADEFTLPTLLLGPHVAPLGIDFYTGQMFPENYVNHAFIAEHGSWNRREKIGYRVKLVHFDESGMAVDQEVFAEGWLQGEDHWGRPVDVETLPDGSILISDDYANAIYRITYSEEDSS